MAAKSKSSVSTTAASSTNWSAKESRCRSIWREELDVEWAGHPNWYFRISKFSIPYLKHPSVPKTWFLDQLRELPSDNQNYLLKPLYSFARSGCTLSR
jgi:hypothetical protein